MVEDSDQKAGDDVNGGNEHGGQSIALAEARRAVHGAIELRFAAHQFAPGSRLGLVNQSRAEVCVNGHLFSGQSVQGEARRHLRDAHRPVVDH